MSKQKGARTERELLNMFYSTGRYIACRVAGSGSTPLPAPDLVVGGMNRVLAIECKSGEKARREIRKEQIEELKIFSKLFGAEPWVGVRFDSMPWYFLEPKYLGKGKGKHFFVNPELVLKKGISFEELVGKYKQKKLL